MVVSSSTPARLPSEPIMFQFTMILLISHRNQKKKGENMGETPRKSRRRGTRVVIKKSNIDNYKLISSDCSRAGVDEEIALVCFQRRRTEGATAVR